MSNCLYCGKPVSDEETKARYEELVKQGIVPNLIATHKECRENEQHKLWRK